MNITFDATFIMIIILVVAIFVLMFMIIQLNNKLKKFLVGHNAETMSDSISSMENSLKEYGQFKGDMETYLLGVEKRLKKSVQAIHTVRFNPFKGSGSGGNQSFATAFLNENNDGVVVSTLYAREHISIFSKPVQNGASEYELSEEEKEAIDGATKKVK